MVDIARQPILTSRVPLRTIGLGLLLVALILAAVAAFVVGTQRNLPAPFGLGTERPGRVCQGWRHLHGRSGYRRSRRDRHRTGDRPTARLLARWHSARFRATVKGATGPGLALCRRSRWDRPRPSDAGRSSGPSRATPSRLTGGRSCSQRDPLGCRPCFIAKSDGSSAPRTLSVGTLSPSEPSYRPPDGGEIAFVGQQPGESAAGLYAIKPDGTGLRPIAQPENLAVLIRHLVAGRIPDRLQRGRGRLRIRWVAASRLHRHRGRARPSNGAGRSRQRRAGRRGLVE